MNHWGEMNYIYDHKKLAQQKQVPDLPVSVSILKCPSTFPAEIIYNILALTPMSLLVAVTAITSELTAASSLIDTM